MEQPAATSRLSPDDGRTCPWCGSRDTERIGEWGPQLLTEQWRCRACRTPFERIRREP
jgi:ring-1,2-phenylacetyl-CoA epoxidase subunit PaaD